MVESIRKERCYIASKERLRRRYASRQNLRNKTGKKHLSIADNSVPWAPAPTSLEEILAISDQITKHCADLRENFFK
ncbi:MAG: hypothetical protein SH807_04290 [Blastochloris sp.]|nr:hypothetical protein [Blastochloris sp.]